VDGTNIFHASSLLSRLTTIHDVDGTNIFHASSLLSRLTTIHDVDGIGRKIVKKRRASYSLRDHMMTDKSRERTWGVQQQGVSR